MNSPLEGSRRCKIHASGIYGRGKAGQEGVTFVGWVQAGASPDYRRACAPVSVARQCMRLYCTRPAPRPVSGMRFLPTFLASVLGTLTAMGCAVFVVFVIVLGFATAGVATPSIASGSVLVLEIDGDIADISAADPVTAMFGDEHLDLADIRQALHMAAVDERIAAVWLQVGSVSSGWATLQEVRAALERFHASGKPLYASARGPHMAEAGYFLASVADTVAVQPLTIFEFNGFVLTAEFYKRLLDKLDVQAEVVRAGSFKGAVEPYIREDLSPENREQLAALLADQNREFLGAVAASRATTPEALESIIQKSAPFSAEAGLEHGLIDALMMPDQVHSLLKARLGMSAGSNLRLVAAEEYAMSSPSEAGVALATGGQVGLVYVTGGIVDGETGESLNPLMGGTVVGDETFRKSMQEARASDAVKAVVLRINSPGGSASASEAMRREIMLTRELKPVIVSMGDYAASGGYWIATGADTIVADPLTITGSIGVFSLLFDAGGLFEDKLGITFDQVQTSPWADLGSSIAPLSRAERAVLQRGVDFTYETFLSHVSAATGLDTARVHEIAQGRVWTGAQAHKLGLVHELGDLRMALDMAAARAGIARDAYRVRVLTKPKSRLERILSGLNSGARAWLASWRSPAERALGERAAMYEALVRQHGQVQAVMPVQFTLR